VSITVAAALAAAALLGIGAANAKAAPSFGQDSTFSDEPAQALGGLARRGTGFVFLYAPIALSTRVRVSDPQGLFPNPSFSLSAAGFAPTLGVNDDQNVLVVAGEEAAIFDADGAQIGPVHTGVGGRDNYVARNGSGFVVAWTSEVGDSVTEPKMQLTDFEGAPLGPPTVTTTSSALGRSISVAGQPGGGFVVVWDEFESPPGRIMGRGYDADGTPTGPDFEIASPTVSSQGLSTPLVEYDPTAANFLVVWDFWDADVVTPDAGIYGRRIDRFGVAGAAFPIVQAAQRPAARALAVLDDGTFLVFRDDLDLQRFDADGNEVGTAVRANLGDVGLFPRGELRLANLGNGRFAFGYQSRVLDQVRGAVGCIDDGADGDGDGVGDACDPCTGGSEIDTRPKLALKFLTQSPLGNERLAFSGEFALPSPMGFGDIVPVDAGLRLRVETAARLSPLDLALPGGTFAGSGTAGWTINASGSRWLYRDKTPTPRNGIVKVLLVDRSAQSPGHVAIKIKGKDGTYPLSPGDDPVQMVVVWGDSANGECAETAFLPADCAFRSIAKSLQCRR